jgi:hypothetical protein
MKTTVHIVTKRDRHAFEMLSGQWVPERSFALSSKHRRAVRTQESDLQPR